MAQPKSFIENVNVIANASTLATGDVVEDAQIARDAAEAAAASATSSAADSLATSLESRDWAVKAFNSEVSPGEYSSYHWSIISQQNSGEALIDDIVVSSTTTFSSTKITAELTDKAESDHLHTGVYEPSISKGTAFNKEFTTSGAETGTSETVARGDHNHNSTYEFTIATKNTAFNKDFGTSSGTIAEGDHTHDYESSFSKNTAFNKNFVVDTTAPTANEIPRGNHKHASTNISYDNSGNKIIKTSETVQGAIEQLDSSLGVIETAEKCKIKAGMTNAAETISITTIDTATKLITAMTLDANTRNLLYSGGDIVLDYSEDPTNLVEGWYSASVTIDAALNTKYSIGIAIDDAVIDPKFISSIGSAASPAGAKELTITGYISGLGNGQRLSTMLYNNTGTTNISIVAHTVSFSGVPDGALVSSGLTVAHSDTTGKDAVLQHPFESIYESGSSTDLVTILDTKADKAIPGTANNIAILGPTGNLIDSSVQISAIGASMNLIASPTLDNIVTMTAGGDSKDSGVQVSDFATLNGDSTELFEVATATLDTHAITKATFDSTVATLATSSDLSTHTARTDNPHSVTYTQTGGAAASHTHAIGNVTGLQDDLDNKYDEVVGAVQDNIVTFDTTGVLQDSGVSVTAAANTALSTGTVTGTTYGITSDGGTDDVVLIEATTTTAGLLGAANWNKLDTAYTHSQTAHAPSNADQTSANETSHDDVVVDGDFTSNGILNRTGVGTYSILSIGSDIQEYDADTAKTDIAQTFTAPQRSTAVTEDASIAFNSGNNIKFSMTSNSALTVVNQTVDQSGVIVITGADHITAYPTEFDFGIQGAPTSFAVDDVATFAYYISGASGADSIKIGVL